MEWGKTLLWVLRGSAAGMFIYALLVLGVYLLVPLESAETAGALVADLR